MRNDLTSNLTTSSRRFDLVMLDLDGTLVDSEALLVGLVNQTLAAHGLPLADTRTVAAAIGLPLDEVFRRALSAGQCEGIADLCVAYRRKADTPEFVRQFRLYRDVYETLEVLRPGGSRLVLATSKGRATSLEILRHCAIAGMIDEVIGGDTVVRGKPDREMIDHARSRFDTAAARTVIVGDTSFDLEMGKSAGVSTCAVTYGMHPADELRSLGPDFVISRFADLRDVVLEHPA